MIDVDEADGEQACPQPRDRGRTQQWPAAGTGQLIRPMSRQMRVTVVRLRDVSRDCSFATTSRSSMGGKHVIAGS